MAEHAHVVMFSSGAGSAVAGKLVADRYGTENLILLFADVNGEHGDNYRFLREAAAWIGGQLVVLDNGGRTIWQIFAERRFLGNHRVDPCSQELKRKPMRRWLEDHCDPATTVVYLGFDWTEEHRLQRSMRYWAPWRMEAPMCWEPAMDKAEALKMLETAGIEPPLLTRLGFPHANCGGGCVKAGIKQFKKLLEVAPETYAWWEWNEERMRALLGRDVALLTDRSGGRSGADRRPMSLRELRERTATRTAVFTDEDWGACNCLMSEEATLNDRNAEAPIGAGASHPSTEASGGAPQQYSEPREILGFFVGEDTVISTIPERASMSDEAEREE